MVIVVMKYFSTYSPVSKCIKILICYILVKGQQGTSGPPQYSISQTSGQNHPNVNNEISGALNQFKRIYLFDYFESVISFHFWKVFF